MNAKARQRELPGFIVLSLPEMQRSTRYIVPSKLEMARHANAHSGAYTP
jgi:hypothetical protein